MYKLSPTQRIVFAGVLAAIAVVFGTLKVRLGLLAISFLYIPCMISGIFLGPVYGFLVGVTGDLLGTIIQGAGAPSPIIMFGNGMIGVISAVAFSFKAVKNPYVRIAIGGFFTLLIVTLGINTMALVLPPISLRPTYAIALSLRIPSQTPVVFINTGLVLIAYAALEQSYFRKFRQPPNTDINPK